MKYRFVLDDVRNISNHLKYCEVDLVVTSPPYFDIKDYGSAKQIGFNQSYSEYLNDLFSVLMGCFYYLKDGGKMAIVIGDKFQKSTKNKPFHIYPISSDLISHFSKSGHINYEGTINWVKRTSSKPSGGGHVLGSYPYPPNGIFFTNREYILIFKKNGKCKKPRGKNILKRSKLTKEEWRLYFNDTWKVRPAKLDKHPAAFPIEIPRRLIKMYSFYGNLVLDPFMGSATTAEACAELGRSFVGFEVGFDSPTGVSSDRLLATTMNGIKMATGGKGEYEITK